MPDDIEGREPTYEGREQDVCRCVCAVDRVEMRDALERLAACLGSAREQVEVVAEVIAGER